MEDLREIDNRIYFEDALLTWHVMPILNERHHLEVEKSYRHVRVAQYEVDAVLVCHTPERIERFIGFELKVSDFDKAMKQARLRRKYFDYFYIIIDWSVGGIVDYLLKMVQNGENLDGIGFISSECRTTLVLQSKYVKRQRIEMKNGREIPENQLSLMKFLEEQK